MTESLDRNRSQEMISRLLGPEAPELTCEECFERLDEYVELDVTDQSPDKAIPGMRAHLEGCPACAEDYGSLRDLVVSEQS